MDSQETIHSLFEKQAQLQANKPAVFFGSDCLTYQELNERANQLAHHLIRLGAIQNRPIAFCMQRSVDCLVTMLAILKVGAGYMPLDPTHPELRLLSLLKHSESALLITQSRFAAKFTGFEGKLIVLENAKLNTCPKHNPNLSVFANFLAYLIYTSGSTGTPKGVLIEHTSVLNYCSWFAEYTKISAKQCFDFSSNHCFDMAVTVTLIPLMLGLTLVICEEATKTQIRLYLDYLNQYKIQVIKVTPSYFKLLLQEVQYHKIRLPFLKHIILGGENLSSKDCKAWLDLYPKHCLYNEYGPTETTVAVSQFKVTKSNVNELETNVPIGRPGKNMSCYILDANNRPVVADGVGELYVGGDCLARGYLNQPAQTQKQFIELPASELGASAINSKVLRLYKTGDLCRFRQDLELEYLGRIDSQVKIRGFRVDLTEIERYLSLYPSISNVIVHAQKEQTGTYKLMAYYLLTADATEPKAKNLGEYLRKFLPEFMIPSAFICLKTFPLTANGKIQTELLPKSALQASTIRPPQSNLQIKLAEIWSEELHVPQIGLDEDFFELGGHSLSAARIISKIRHLLGFDVSIVDFYSAATIDALSILLATKKPKKIKKLRLTKNTNQGLLPLSDFQFVLWITQKFQFNVKNLNIILRKRLQGPIDETALNFALNATLNKHDVFSYRISLFKPMQRRVSMNPVAVNTSDLKSYNAQESKKILEQSMNELTYFSKWKKNQPLVAARLFYLKQDRIELQISLSHLICDDASSQIILNDLSAFYLSYVNQTKNSVQPHKLFSNYVLNEQTYTQKFLSRDIAFWSNYLKDAALVSFPEAYIVRDMQSSNLPYSTHKKLPEDVLEHFELFCKTNKINLYEGLVAALGLALRDFSKNTGFVCINRVKSARTEAVFDDALGCFLKVEPIKIVLNENSSFESCVEALHQSILDTSPYQQSPTLIKLCAIKNFNNPKESFLKFFIKPLVTLYSTLFSFPKNIRQILQQSLQPLASSRAPTEFLININIHAGFLSRSEAKVSLFNLKEIVLENTAADLLKIDGVLEICFKPDEQNRPYLVISGNLKPQFRMSLSNRIIEVLRSNQYTTVGSRLKVDKAIP